MPELPDVTVYVECLRPRVTGRVLRRITVRGPFLVRTVDPPVEAAEAETCTGVSRLGKRIVLEFGDLFLVIHLMIAGRLRWFESEHRPGGRIDLAAMAFDAGTLVLTEAGTRKRASLHVVRGHDGLRALDPGGLDVLASDLASFAAALRRENRTIKRALTDPRTLSGIGNAYSDEILHAARLSPLKTTATLTDAELTSLHAAARAVLTEWIRRLRAEFGLAAGSPGRFPGPGQITAFRDGFKVHGRFGQRCPDCASPVQRIVYAENELNYCPGCQTGGRVLKDRSLSRLLREDWPGTIEELG